MNFELYFDRVVVINLKKRTDRLAKFYQTLKRCDWPFRQPEVFVAVDERSISVPEKFINMRSALACTCSHQQVMEQAISDKVKSLLILEDDVCFKDDFHIRIKRFLKTVPADWDGLMIGGQHVCKTGKATLIKSGVVRCMDCERCHCYALRGSYLRKLCQRLKSRGNFHGQICNDIIMGRDPALQMAHNVYAPKLFLAGQERSWSDISKTVFPRRFWNPPSPKLSVINLHGTQPLVAALREHGWYTGHKRDLKNDLDVGLQNVFRKTKIGSMNRINALRKWIIRVQWEVGDDPDFVCTVWHPQALSKLVKAASPWAVYEVNAQTVHEALQQIPEKLRRPCLPIF